MHNKYDCEKCANRSAITCEKCQIVILPDGAGKMPSMYVDQIDIVDRDPEAIKLATYIYYYLTMGRALPIEEVLRYNSKIEQLRRSATE